MPYSITKDCISCDSCRSLCPTDAIRKEDGEYWIDPTLCNNCDSLDSQARCVIACPVDSPIPLQAKKGRCRTDFRSLPSQELFLTGSTPFASSIVIWELCNMLSQRGSLPWQADAHGKLAYLREVHGGKGHLTFRLADPQDPEVTPLSFEAGKAEVATFDLRATCLNLIFAACATTLTTPWAESFSVDDQQLERYLGLDKRRDLRKLEKLIIVKLLVEQACSALVSIEWPRQGDVGPFTVAEDRIWHLRDVQYYFQEDELGCKHLVGLTFNIKAGAWSEYFLNKQTYQNRTAFYQYSRLPQSLLHEIMGNWQQHEGAVRMLTWLLFKTRFGEDQPITVRTLLRIGYGEERVLEASSQRGAHKRLLRTFESDLEALNTYGLKPVFDPVTYPADIQPLWVKLAAIPDDAEAALDFWTQDGSQNQRLTDTAPRGKWSRLLNARLLSFELPPDWPHKSTKASSKNKAKTRKNAGSQSARSPSSTASSKSAPNLSGSSIVAARKRLQLSQRALADQIGKSQSWIRDVENGRFQPSPQDQTRLLKLLQLEVQTNSCS